MLPSSCEASIEPRAVQEGQRVFEFMHRFIHRLESILWQDLHPLHSGYFLTVVACLGLLALILGMLGMVWMFLVP